MKYTTKSGLELPPEIVELVKKEQTNQGKQGYDINSPDCINWLLTKDGCDFWDAIYNNNFTEFYKLYPKKDLDSYGNEIHKGEIVEVKHSEHNEWVEREFFGIADKSTTGIYGVYDSEYKDLITFTFCRKINDVISESEVKKSELQSQMNDLKAQVKEIEAKINEL